MIILRNSKLSRIILLFIFTFSLVVATAYAGKIQIPKDKEIKVKFDRKMTISSKELSEGIPILIYLAEPIEIGGFPIIEKGAKGTAFVAEVQKAGRKGKPGYIKIQFVDLEPKGKFKAKEGEKIKLDGFAEKKGKGKKLLSYLFIAGLFIKGGEGEIRTDYIYPVKVAESIILESE